MTTDQGPTHGAPAFEHARGLACWPLPLLGGLLPAFGALAAWHLSIAEGTIPACAPLLDGCVSVSRAARHGLANLVFRACVLPAATLQALTWLLIASKIGATQPAHATPHGLSRTRAIAILGVIAGTSLVVYGTFLGTDGPGYRFMRQYGTIVYFGFTFLCIALHAAQIEAGAWRRGFVALLAGVLTCGLVNAFVARLFDATAQDRVENIAEWWAAAGLMSAFVLIALRWRDVRLHVGPAPPPRRIV